MITGARVPLDAGLWAVVLVLVLSAILWTALRSVRRRKEPSMACSTPGSLGRHPLGEPAEGGVRRCDCGIVTSIPAGGSAIVGGVIYAVGTEHVGTPVEVARPRLELVPRTDTAELPCPGAHARAVASGHPSVWEPPTVELPRPQLARPPR